MTLLNHLLLLRAATLSAEQHATILYPPNWTPAGEPPENIEGDDTIVYGDNIIALFPEVNTPCDVSPTGQCEFNALAPDHERCIHCKRITG